ncbi:MAG TPA: hypothetical protein VMR45_01890 [Patescibacteria group bacterium]|nr:hypothetical protein [Patescibacteria group bacterium]
MIKLNKKYLSWLWLLPIAVPFLVALALVIKYGVNTPFMDEWELVRLFHKLYEGGLSINDFWIQHNEHRIFFVSITTVVLGYITHWNLIAQMLVSLSLVLAMLVVFCVYCKKDMKIGPQYAIYLTLISVLIFSAGQWENWVRGFQMQWFFCTFSGVFALYLLDKRATLSRYNARYILAIFFCIVSSYSLGSGIFFWPACLVPLIATKQSFRRIAAWCCVGAATFTFYFYNYIFFKRAPTGAHAVHYAQFFFAYLGNALAHDPEVAVIFGMVLSGLACFAVYYALIVKRIALDKIALPIGLIIFVVMSAMITAQSRTNVTGAFGATTSKYATVSTLLIVALVLLYMQIMKTKSLAPPILLAVIILPIIAGISLYGIREMRQMKLTLTAVKTCLSQSQPTEQCLGSAHPSAEKVKIELRFLKEKHLAGY